MLCFHLWLIFQTKLGAMIGNEIHIIQIPVVKPGYTYQHFVKAIYKLACMTHVYDFHKLSIVGGIHEHHKQA